MSTLLGIKVGIMGAKVGTEGFEGAQVGFIAFVGEVVLTVLDVGDKVGMDDLVGNKEDRPIVDNCDVGAAVVVEYELGSEHCGVDSGTHCLYESEPPQTAPGSQHTEDVVHCPPLVGKQPATVSS